MCRPWPGPSFVDSCAARAPDGSVYLILLTARDDPGRIVAAFDAGADDYLCKAASDAEIVARIRAGERVLGLVMQQRERASELEAIIDNHPAGIVVMDAPTSNVIRINGHACRLLHVRRQEVMNRSARGLIGAPGGARTGLEGRDASTLWARLVAGDDARAEIRATGADGGIAVTDITIAPVRNARGRITQYVAFVQDITDRMRAQETLRRAHARTEQLLTAISSILIGLDQDDRITDWNATAENAFGIKAQAVVGHPLAVCSIGWDADVVREYVTQARAREPPRASAGNALPAPGRNGGRPGVGHEPDQM